MKTTGTRLGIIVAYLLQTITLWQVTQTEKPIRITHNKQSRKVGQGLAKPNLITIRTATLRTPDKITGKNTRAKKEWHPTHNSSSDHYGIVTYDLMRSKVIRLIQSCIKIQQKYYINYNLHPRSLRITCRYNTKQMSY